jgi:RNA polymerase sigma-70 factor (ECF subfamily)
MVMSDLVAERPTEHASSDRLHELVTRHFSFVWRSLLRLGVPEGDAEDALQQVFIVASRRLEDITPGSEQAFLFTTTLHVAARARRTRSRRREVPDADVEEPRDPAPAPDERLDRERARERLHELLDAMPEDLRAVFVLHELEQMSSPAIAAMLEVPVGTVASRLRRAREAFRAAVQRLQASRTFRRDP